MKRPLHTLLGIALVFLPMLGMAQVPTDSTKGKEKIPVTKKAFLKGLGYITTSKKDTVVNESSTLANQEYEGKIIRNIDIEFIELKRSLYDTAKRTKKIIADISDALHSTTRLSVIRNHLFFHENKPLNPHLLADNERYLRDLDFILDSRIVATPVPGSEDSVDVLVITRDVFSLGFRMGGTIPTSPKIGIYDANFLGRGQRLEFTALLDQDRTPKFGYSALYRKSSAFGSLASIELAYSQLNTGRSYGEETEFAYYIRVNRPLVSPYSRLAGGFEFSNNWSENVYGDPDSLFLQYRYKISDGWIGYNFGIHKDFSNRNRHFVSVRYFDGYFMNQPEQEEYKDAREYNNQNGYLAEYTFYRQNYFKTRYVFGFGRTEDVPYGFSFSVTGGYLTQLSRERPYAAAQWRQAFANRKGNFYIFNFQVGGYKRLEEIEDAVVTGTVDYVTRALNINRYKARAFFRVGYAQLFNPKVADPVEIHDSEVGGFSADSVWGDNKAYMKLETVLYTPWQLFGFRFAPFAGVTNSWLGCSDCDFHRVSVLGFTAGFRTRNENLIFGTMEIRVNYIPQTFLTPSQVSFEFRQRLKLKSAGSFVKPPALIQY